MKFKATVVCTQEYDIDPSDEYDRLNWNFEEGAGPSDIAEAITESIEEDLDTFLDEADISPPTVEKIK